MEKSKNSSSFKVLMLPWLAHGHVAPQLQLAQKLVLADEKCQVYLCSTRVNLDFVGKIFDKNISIELVELHLADTHGLPPQQLTTKDTPPHLVPKLVEAFQSAETSFGATLDALRPDLVIYDAFQTWAPTLAAERNIPAVYFVALSAVSNAYLYHAERSSPFPFPSMSLAEYFPNKPPSKEFAKYSPTRGLKLSSEMILIKTSSEIEARYVEHLSFLSGKEMVATGPLFQEELDDQSPSNVRDFLNGKPESSVVFVNFGSECYLSEEEREELAHGLELSNVGFIWVIRFPAGAQTVADVKDAVPLGFLERVKNRGMVIEGWAPQAEILEHKSVGGFLSHCGWGSILESLSSGVPIIALPMKFEQPINARLVVEIGAGLEVVRDENGKMKRAEIAGAIKAVMVDQSGQDFRAKARALSASLKRGQEEQYAVDKIWKLCAKYKHINATNLEEI